MYGIITYHRALNAGAVLQCYALSQFMNNIGLPNMVLDYRNERNDRRNDSMPKRLARAAVLGPVLARRAKKFKAFRQKHLNLSRPYLSIDELNADAGSYTAFITGSDQVFSADCALFDPAYFLRFPNAQGKRYSYAASFGSDGLPENLRQEYFQRLSGFPFLSIREQSGVDLAKECLRLKIPVESHIDPVLLLDAGTWSRLAQKPKEQDYIFLYTMLPSATIFSKAQELSKKTGLPVLWANDKYYQTYRGISHRLAVSPEELLGYIAGARYVITNSFHGTAFSIIFERKFMVEANKSKGSRSDNLLSLLGLDNRAYDNIEDDIDWVAVRQRIENEKKRAATYFEQIRKNAEGL